MCYFKKLFTCQVKGARVWVLGSCVYGAANARAAVGMAVVAPVRNPRGSCQNIVRKDTRTLKSNMIH